MLTLQSNWIYIRSPRRLLILAAVCALTAVGGLSSLQPAAASTSDTCVETSGQPSWSQSAKDAKAALNRTVSNVQQDKLGAALNSVKTLNHEVRKAHTSATALIGLPPTDPEGETPPGVRAVLNVDHLEHQVVTQLIPTLDNLNAGDLVARLSRTLNVTAACRDIMLGNVIDLRPGKRDPYADGLSDTLPDYEQELALTNTALTTYQLTTRSQAALGYARAVITDTQTAMNKVFGGGE